MFELIGIVGIVAGVIVLIALGFLAWQIKTILNMRVVVPTNMVHIVQSKKSTISYGKGREAGNVYYEWPTWLPFIGVTVSKFPESVFDVSLTNYEAYDSGRLPFVVDVKAFYRVSESDIAAQRVFTFEELKQQLQSILQGAVRRVLATDKLENIMEDRAGLGKRFTDEVDAQLKEWGVKTVKLIEFMDLRDSNESSVIENIMAKEKSRIEKESRVVVAANLQEAQLKEIDAQRTVEVQQQDALQQVGLRTAEKDKTVGIANEKAQQDIKEQAKVTAQRNMDVAQVEHVRAAEIARDVATVEAEKDKKVTVITAEAAKDAQVTRAEGVKMETITIAAGKLDAARFNAQGLEAEGLAKGVAEKAILMAPVETQITLAKEIGLNQGYQTYLIQIRQVEASRDVGLATAGALAKADMKVIANSGNVMAGVGTLGDVLTPGGGTNFAGMLTALAQSDEGKALVDGLLGKLGGGGTPSVKVTKNTNIK